MLHDNWVFGQTLVLWSPDWVQRAFPSGLVQTPPARVETRPEDEDDTRDRGVGLGPEPGYRTCKEGLARTQLQWGAAPRALMEIPYFRSR